MAKMKKLEDLFHDTLKDVYFAEKKILANLPTMAKAAQHTGLAAACATTAYNQVQSTDGQPLSTGPHEQ